MFALILEFAPESPKRCERVMEREPDRNPSCFGRPTAPSVHTALAEFGLKVEPTKAPKEFIVVDRVDRPSPN
jgi:uncharacterized protein (TIGR03435 family)